MHQEGHIESGSGVSSGGGTSRPRETNRRIYGSMGSDMGNVSMGNPSMNNGLFGNMSGLGGSLPEVMGLAYGGGDGSIATMGSRSPLVNMSLPMANSIPIVVDENTGNLQRIQSFPLVGQGPNGIHFHQDPITGQMYRMTDELHQRLMTTTQYIDVVDSFFTGDTASRNGGLVNVDTVGGLMNGGLMDGGLMTGGGMMDGGGMVNTGVRNGGISTVGSTDVVTTMDLGTFIDQTDLLNISTAQNANNVRVVTNEPINPYSNGMGVGGGMVAGGVNRMAETATGGLGQTNIPIDVGTLRVYNFGQQIDQESSLVDSMGRYTPVNVYSSDPIGGYEGGGTFQSARKQLNVYAGDPIGSGEGTEYFAFIPVNVYSASPRSIAM